MTLRIQTLLLHVIGIIYVFKFYLNCISELDVLETQVECNMENNYLVFHNVHTN